MFPQVSAGCPRCACDDATFLHMVWQCECLKLRWSQVLSVIAEVIGTPLPLTPRVCLLGLITRKKINKIYLKFADLAMVLFRRLIVKGWKASTPLALSAWLREVQKWTVVEADALS